MTRYFRTLRVWGDIVAGLISRDESEYGDVLFVGDGNGSEEYVPLHICEELTDYFEEVWRCKECKELSTCQGGATLCPQCQLNLIVKQQEAPLCHKCGSVLGEQRYVLEGKTYCIPCAVAVNREPKDEEIVLLDVKDGWFKPFWVGKEIDVAIASKGLWKDWFRGWVFSDGQVRTDTHVLLKCYNKELDKYGLTANATKPVSESGHVAVVGVEVAKQVRWVR